MSHTPSPRPQRECDSRGRTDQQRNRQDSGEKRASGAGSHHSSERRSALERITLTQERIPLLQDEVANAESGRLQEVDIQYLEDTMPTTRVASVPSTSRNPTHSNFEGEARKILPSSAKNPSRGNGSNYDASQNRSPIRTLSEDRVHVSLRL